MKVLWFIIQTMDGGKMKKIDRFLSSIFLTALIFGSTILSSCYQMFQSKIPMDSLDALSTLSDLFYKPEEITQLDSPKQVFASSRMSQKIIQVSWSAVNGAASYRLERAILTDPEKKVPEDEDFALIPSSKNSLVSSSYITDTSFTDVILENPDYSSEEYDYRFFYRVSAENSFKKYESSVFAYSSEGRLFAPPSNLVAQCGESSTKIALKWNTTKGASVYKIYRTKDSKGYNDVLVATVSAAITNYDDKVAASEQGVDYYYSVTAVNSSGQESVKSGLALGYALKEGAPTRVSGVKVDLGRGDSDSSIKISWSKVSGDCHYAIYRTSSQDSSFNLIASDTTATSYEDKKSLKPNVYYYYYIMAFTGSGENMVKGPVSDSGPGSSDPAEGFIIGVPSDYSVSKSGTTATIKFAAALGEKNCPLDSGLSSNYNVYGYKIFGGNSPDKVDVDIPFTLGSTKNGYYSVEVPVYGYYIIQTTKGTVKSKASNVFAPCPNSATNLSVTRRAKIPEWTDSLSKANSSGVYPVKITWSSPDGGAEGGYFVYRSTTEDSGYKKITESPVTECEYIDSSDVAKAGIRYYYKVLSLNSFAQGANYSDSEYGYGALTYDQYMREYNKTVLASQKKLTLMHKSGNTDKLGTETVQGKISGDLYYNAGVQGLGGRVIMKYTNYAEFYINGSDSDVYFLIDGNTNTSASMDASGTMDGTVICKGMYPGKVEYDNVIIKGGAANGGYYLITPEGFEPGKVSYTVGNE